MRKLGIVESCSNRSVKGGDERLRCGLRFVVRGDVLNSGGGDDMPVLREDPIAEVTSHAMRDTKPSSKSSVGGAEGITWYVVPHSVVKRKVCPFRDVGSIAVRSPRAV